MIESKISNSKDVPLWHKVLCTFVSLCLVVSLNPHLALALDDSGEAAASSGSEAAVTQSDQGTTEDSNNEFAEVATSETGATEADQEASSNDAVNSSAAPQPSSDSVSEANNSGSSVSLQDDAVTIKTSVPVKPGETTSTQHYAVGDKVSTYTKDSSGNEITADKLTYQWKSSATKNGAYTDIDGATNQILDIDASLEGKYLQCLVAIKDGSSTYTANVRQPIAAAGSFAIDQVTVDKSGELAVGDTITATATAATGDVSNDSHVTWSWYYGSYSSSANTKIEGQTGRTLTITSDMGLNGKYIKATANGGLGDKSSSIIGPVSIPGAVELYKIEVAGSAKVGSKLTATAYKENSYTKVSDSDTVTYQWQKSDTKSSSDSAFSDIAGANSKTLDITDDLIGKYIRVKATSNNSVVSTKTKSYYGDTSVDPVGPVTKAGQYTLSSATVAEATSATLNSGVTLTPKAKVKSGYYESDAPADAKLTFTWYSSDNKTDWTEVTSNIDATTKVLTLTDELVGKYVKFDAYSLDNTVSWVSSYAVNKEGEFNLLRVTTTPYSTSSTTQLVTGDSVSATVQATRIDGGTSYGVDVSDKVSIQWLVSDTSDGEYSALEEISGKQVTLPDAAAGKFLKVQVTSGPSTVETKFENSVLDKASLAALVQKLKDGSYRPGLTYGGESNLNKVVEQDIKDKYSTEGVTVKVKSVKFAATDVKATVGISSADDETNGDVTWFYIDPNDYSGWSMTQLYNATVTLELTKGDETVEYSPRSFSVPWDEDKLLAAMDEAGKAISIGYSTGDSAESVTSKMTLPNKAGSNKKYSVTWTSSSDNIKVTGYSWSDYYTGTVERTAYDVDVILTATIKVTSGADGIETTVDFPVTVKGDPEKVKEEIKNLETKLSNNFTDANITYATTGEKANLDALKQDIILPRPATIGVDGKYYEVKYTIGEPASGSGSDAGLSGDDSSDPIVVNGYRGNVYQPLPGESAAKTRITCTVTSKANSEIEASKTLDATVIPLEQSAIDAEVALMAQAKAGYADAILEGQGADAVTNNLHAFKKAYLKDGQLAWAYSSTTGNAVDGIIATDLPGYDSMGTQGWRTFKSSKPNVVSHENLLVNQPTYNTKVTITSRLSSEKFARYAERYPENSTFASLANQEVTANITVTGSTGQDDPNAGKQITVNAKVTAVSEADDQGKYTDIVVAPLTEFTLDYDSTPNAEEVLEQLMTKAGCTNLVCGAWGLTSATLPDGRTLDTTSTAPYSYWSFWVNNEEANVGAPSYYLNDGDTVEFRYVKGDGEKQDSGSIDVNPDAQGPDWSSEWPSYNKGNGAVTDASTPTGQTKEEWTFDYKAYIQHQWPNASEPIIAGGYIYLAVDNRLLQIDKSSGKVLKVGKLAGNIGYTTRPVYANGLVIVPLDGGSVQALTADNLETKWVTEEINELMTQSNSSIAVNGNYIYVGTVDVDYATSTYNNGHFTKININTGAIAWQNVDENEGYYWGGALVNDDFVIVSTSAGTVKVFNNADGKEISSLSLGTLVNSDCVMAPDGKNIIVMTRDGKMNLISVDEGGKASLANSFDLGLSGSASTPVVSGNNVYVGGETSNGAGSALAVVIFNDGVPTTTLISNADGATLPSGGIKGAPLVSVQNSATYVYFTVNNATSDDRGKTYSSGGGIYRYKLGDNEAKLIYDAAGHNQYCDSPVICDENGVLYYINDSCTLFAISASDSVDPTPTPDPTPNPDSEESGEGSSSGTKSNGTVLGRYALVATSRLKVIASTDSSKDKAQAKKQANSAGNQQQNFGNQAEEPAKTLANASEPVTQNLIFLAGGLMLLIIAVGTSVYIYRIRKRG